MSKTQALTLVRAGELEIRETLQEPDLQEHEVLVQVQYTGVQPMDGEMFSCQGRFNNLPLPHVMGVEGVGTVLKTRNSDFSEGSRIAFILRRFFQDDAHGCWQSVVVLNPERVFMIPVPVDVGLNQVAPCTTSTCSALGFLRHFPVGSTLVVTGCCGASGLAILQLGALRGYRMVGLARGAERAAWLVKELSDCGSVAIIDTSVPEWQKVAIPVCSRGETRSATVAGSGDIGGGADGLIDGVGTELVNMIAEELLRERAVIIRYGSIGGPVDEQRLAVTAQKLCLDIREGSVEQFVETSDAAAQVEGAFSLIAQNKYRPKAFHVVTWREAHECMREQPVWTRHVTQLKPGRLGRIILKFD